MRVRVRFLKIQSERKKTKKLSKKFGNQEKQLVYKAVKLDIFMSFHVNVHWAAYCPLSLYLTFPLSQILCMLENGLKNRYLIRDYTKIFPVQFAQQKLMSLYFPAVLTNRTIEHTNFEPVSSSDAQKNTSGKIIGLFRVRVLR